MLPRKLEQKIQQRINANNLRTLGSQTTCVDFSSNDYLGFSKSKSIFNQTHQYLKDTQYIQNGATGSRLLSGNHPLYSIIEQQIATFHQAESALVFNSGYDANIGFFAAVPQRGDVILYDEHIHASIRDGIQLSNAKAYKFKHNDVNSLKEKLQNQSENAHIYVVTESVFSMDGDSPDLTEISTLCKQNKAHLIVDEAHALGVIGLKGSGLTQKQDLKEDVFARIITFGKALGSHGAVILGSQQLTEYLINFARSFIYTTALSPHTLATIKTAYQELLSTNETDKLNNNISYFKQQIGIHKLEDRFIESNSAIQSCIVSGNKQVKAAALQFQTKGFDVKAILSPTVPKNQERLRFCIHSYNTEYEIATVLQLLATFVV